MAIWPLVEEVLEVESETASTGLPSPPPQALPQTQSDPGDRHARRPRPQRRLHLEPYGVGSGVHGWQICPRRLGSWCLPYGLTPTTHRATIAWLVSGKRP